MDQKSDSKLFPPIQFLTVDNVDYSTTNAVKKRRGFKAHGNTNIDGTSPSPSTVQALWSRDEKLQLIGAQRMYRYSESADGWITSSANSPHDYDLLVSKSEALGPSVYGDADGFDTAYANGHLCVVSLIKGINQADISIYESATGQLIARAPFNTGGTSAELISCRIVVLGTAFHCIFVSGGKLNFVKFDSASISSGFTRVSTGVATASGANLAFDATTDGVYIYIAWCDASPNLRVARFNPAAAYAVVSFTTIGAIVADITFNIFSLFTINIKE